MFGTWHVDVLESGTYRIELSRWPFESGKTLTEGAFTREPENNFLNVKKWSKAGKIPIASATLHVVRRRDDKLEKTAKAQPQDTKITFEMELPEGPQRVMTWFHDASGEKLCGAHYVRVTLLK